MAYPVPENWTVTGSLNKNGEAFSQGKVYAYNLKDGELEQIAESGIHSDGSFSLLFSKWMFQKGDESIEYPTLKIRVYDNQGNLLWESGIYEEPDSNLNTGFIDILKPASENGNCLVYGLVQNEQGKILSGIIVKAFCLYFVETTDSKGNASGAFKTVNLGSIVSDSSGKYEIHYNSTLLPGGLVLDSLEDYGKDKASLFAEAYTLNSLGQEVRLAVEHLVFNGKTEQEINFTLRVKQDSFLCEFEELESVLRVYHDAIFMDFSGTDIGNDDKIRALGVFLNSNTKFPLVVGRERITELLVQAYFRAYSLYYQLVKRLKSEAGSYEQGEWCEYFYALALRENVSGLNQLIKMKPTKLQKTLLGAYSDGIICKGNVANFLTLWKTLLGQGNDGEAENDSLTVSQLLSLYIKGTLSIEVDKEGDAYYVPIENFDAKEQKSYDYLLELYYKEGADNDSFISAVKENEEIWTEESDYPEEDALKLKAVFELNEFFEQFTAGVVCTYRYALGKSRESGGFYFDRFADLIFLEESDWKDIVENIASDYGEIYNRESVESSPALPAEFPGNNLDVKKVIYTRKLAALINSWLPQRALLVKLSNSDYFSAVCEILLGVDWDDFSLSNSDLGQYVEAHESIGTLDFDTKESILWLQRLYHLTSDADAIAYLAGEGFKSSYEIASMGEEDFVALHGNGIGKADDARQIHRLAANYIAEAALNIQAYAADNAEEEETLPSLPRSVSSKAKLLSAGSASLNATANRNATRDTVNWAKLFGNINYTKATEGQSILSASAYYVDLLRFLKKGSACNAFMKRRPDYLDLKLDKANAETPLPTIDLAIELLASLIADTGETGTRQPKSSNTPAGKTSEELRAEPEESAGEIAALEILSQKIYPFCVAKDFNREKAKKILANLSLHFYDIAEIRRTGNSEESGNSCREFCLNPLHRELIDLDTTKNTWDLWGLNQYSDAVPLPDKSAIVKGNYATVLKQLAIFLQRSGFTLQELNTILADSHFKGIKYKAKNAEYYQLSNIDGYEFVNEDFGGSWDVFFKRMAVVVHRRNILGWELPDILLTLDCNLNELDFIVEFSSRYGFTVQDALVVGGLHTLEENSDKLLNAVYGLPELIKTDLSRQKILNLLVKGLDLTEEMALAIYEWIGAEKYATSLAVLLECYRRKLLVNALNITVEEIGLLQESGLWEKGKNLDLAEVRSFADEWRDLCNTSIGQDFYMGLCAPVGDDSITAANSFAENLIASGLNDEGNNKFVGDLKTLVCAEFGIAEDEKDEIYGSGLVPTKLWENFYKEAKEIWEDKNTEKSDEVVEVSSEESEAADVEAEKELSKESVATYVNLARRVSVFNYIQGYRQGLDLTAFDFVQVTDDGSFDVVSYESIQPLAYATYAADRLSDEYSLEQLIEVTKTGGTSEAAEMLSLDENDFNQMRDAVFGKDSPDYSDASRWVEFAKYYEIFAQTYTLPNVLDGLLEEDDLGSYKETVKKLEQNIKSHTKSSEWLTFAQEMNDDLRQKKRNALAAFVCFESIRDSRYPMEFLDESDIYSYYLLDVKMEPDMAVSRIVQASASIQLFVQRGELGLEGDNVLNDSQKSEWKWMKNYRVWEAARKVFLFPENWISSDLREDKSPFFEELEERIQEFSADHDGLENALSEYLEKVREVSGIEIVGACKEDGGDEGGILYTLHIVGRTQGEPHAYYYRTYKAKAILSGEWTPWKRLDVDIPAETILPAIVNQRLYLLWPQVVLGQRNAPDVSSDGGSYGVEYYAKVQICWVSYAGNKWTGTKMSKNALFDVSTNPLDFTLADNESIEDRYHLKAVVVQDQVAVSILKTNFHYQEYEEVAGIIDVMEGSTRTSKAVKRIYDYSRQYFAKQATLTIRMDGSDFLTEEENVTEYVVSDFAPERTQLVHGVFVEESEYTCGNKGFSYPEDNSVLGYIPGKFRIVSTNLSMLQTDEEDEAEDLPFFYMDGRHTFFVQAVPKDGDVNLGQKNFKFELLSHSLVDDFYKRYRDGGTNWLYTRETQALPVSDSYYYSYSSYNYYFSVYLGYYMAGDWQAWDLGQTIFRYNYSPSGASVDGPYPAPMVDFVWGGANAIYNWELFFYVPMLIAEKMIAEQSYEEALLWLQLVFNPKENYSHYEKTKHFVDNLPKGARYWKFLPFFANKDADKSILQMLGLPTNRDRLPDRTALSSLVDKWKNDPFNPHLIAKYRLVAYQKYVLMKYLDALIGWGDQEFEKDTTESVNLAVQYYLLAAELLGPRNESGPEPMPNGALTAREVLNKTDDLGNAFIAYENSALIAKDKSKAIRVRSLDTQTRLANGIVEAMFYFSVPRNENLFSYWNIVSDRLYKIRNSLNLQGVKRTLSLFAPPIDPGMLVKARAYGMSIDAILGSDTVRPIYRFKVVVKLAIEMAKEAAQMGRDLLSILEKKDAEQLRLFKAKCDSAVVAENKAVYEMELQTLETEKERLEASVATRQDAVKRRKTQHTESSAEKKYRKLMEKVAKIQETIEKVRNIASASYKVPDFKLGAVANAFGGPRFDMESLGGTKLAENLMSAAEGYAACFAQKQLDAAKTKLQAELSRRAQEWEIEDSLADVEVVELQKQQLANEIKISQVEQRQQNFEKEQERAQDAYDMLSEKFTNRDLYTWLEKEAGKIFKKHVSLVIEMAQKAEACYKFEIEGKSDGSRFMIGTYWESMYKGLLAPERLLLDLRTLEKDYIENSVHEMEITRPIKLSELVSDFASFIKNIESEDGGQFKLEADLFDQDFPGHYFRRIKDARLEVVAPGYEGYYLNAELTLTSCTLYTKEGERHPIVLDSPSIATSLAQHDAGHFDFNFQRESTGPFEGAGVISAWTLKITGDRTKSSGKNSSGVDSLYAIDEIVLHVSYTARMGK
ncbi:neuraminidase-like domain-containing protein [uncultured Fibrobacter sp.]|uniref:Tc toxin subunit A-related protein n=1 Tax=uncultured Fibrobacter sp. TaxID=261512 RepID=UPI00280588DC|nr:neuraminidase-like domain-containing protein [uncultured Fibrobacter sp.]